MGNNMLVFAFEDESDLERVIHFEPWSYDKHFVTFQRVEADTSIAEMDCRWCSFWVQIHNLPVRRMNHDYAKALGGVLDLVEQVAESEEERGREGCMRIRVKMDISKPLCRGRKAWLFAGNETWIAFRYERLPNFCYWCGMLTHGDRDCDRWLRSKGTLRREDQQYGTRLRAVVGKPIRRVEVKVAGRSNAPQWDRRVSPMNDGDILRASHGGDGMATGDDGPSMDFTKMKENLPQFSKGPKIGVEPSEQTSNMGVSIKNSAVTPEDVGFNNEHINQVRDSSELAILITNDTCVSQPIPTEVELIVNSQDVVLGKESEGAKPRVFLQEVSRGTEKTNLNKSRKKKRAVNQHAGSGGKENLGSTIDLNAMHDVVVQGESHGVWKRLLREKTVQVTPGGPSSLSGVKRGGILSEMDPSLVQKKGKGENNVIQHHDVVGDLAVVGE